MADAYQKLYQGQPASTGTVLFTSAGMTIMKHIAVVNQDTADRTVAFYRGGQATTNQWSAAMLVKANGGMAEWDGTEAFANGETLEAIASVSAKLTTTVSGDVVT